MFSSVDDATVREELLVFITPVIVDSNNNDNDSNYNQDYLNRLQEISIPVDEQVNELNKNKRDFLVERLRNPAADYKQSKDSIEPPLDDVEVK